MCFCQFCCSRLRSRSLIAAVKASEGFLAGSDFSTIYAPLSLLIGYDVIFTAIPYMVFDYVVEE